MIGELRCCLFWSLSVHLIPFPFLCACSFNHETLSDPFLGRHGGIPDFECAGCGSSQDGVCARTSTSTCGGAADEGTHRAG